MRYPSSSTRPPSTERDEEGSCCGPHSGQLQGIGSFDTQWELVSSSLASLNAAGLPRGNALVQALPLSSWRLNYRPFDTIATRFRPRSYTRKGRANTFA